MASRGDYRRRDWERDDRDRDRDRERDRYRPRDGPRRSRSRSPPRRGDRGSDRGRGARGPDPRGHGRDREDDRRDRDRRDDRRRDDRDRKDPDRDARKEPPPPRDRDRDTRPPERASNRDRKPEEPQKYVRGEPEARPSAPNPIASVSEEPSKYNSQQASEVPPDGVEEGEEMDATNDEDAAMMAMMGMSGFGTTKGKRVEGNQEGGVDVKKIRTWRQYMNRRGGFNRPLDKIK